jgi:hypothetical protein
MGSQLRARASGWSAIVVTACLVVALAPVGTALGTNLSDFSVTPATGGANIPATTAGGAWTTLTGPVINVVPYSNPDVIPQDALVFQMQLPANFEWNTAKTAAPVVTVAPGSPAGFCTLTATGVSYWNTPGAPPGYKYAQFGLSGTHDVGCQVTFAGLQVRPISSNPAAGTGGNIVVTWTLNGVASAPQNGGAVTMAASAPAVITPATGGSNIPSSTAGGAWTTLNGPTITEGTSGQLSASEIVLTLPANFVFNANVTVAPVASCGYPISSITYYGAGNQATNAKVTVSGHATMSACSISFGQSLQVRPISADPGSGTGGNITVYIDGVASGNGGAVTMSTPPVGTLTLSITSPTMNNSAIIWGESYIDIKTIGTPGTTFQIQASTDQVTWTPLKNSSGAVLSWTIGSSGSSTYRYTPIRNYWYKSVAGSTVSNVVRITVRETCSLSPTYSTAKSVAAGSSTTFKATVRPARSDLPKANVNFQVYKKSGSSWTLSTSVTKTIDDSGVATLSWTWSSGSWYVRAQAQPTSVNSNSFWTKNSYFNAS